MNFQIYQVVEKSDWDLDFEFYHQKLRSARGFFMAFDRAESVVLRSVGMINVIIKWNYKSDRLIVWFSTFQ